MALRELGGRFTWEDRGFPGTLKNVDDRPLELQISNGADELLGVTMQPTWRRGFTRPRHGRINLNVGGENRTFSFERDGGGNSEPVDLDIEGFPEESISCTQEREGHKEAYHIDLPVQCETGAWMTFQEANHQRRQEDLFDSFLLRLEGYRAVRRLRGTYNRGQGTRAARVDFTVVDDNDTRLLPVKSWSKRLVRSQYTDLHADFVEPTGESYVFRPVRFGDHSFPPDEIDDYFWRSLNPPRSIELRKAMSTNIESWDSTRAVYSRYMRFEARHQHIEIAMVPDSQEVGGEQEIETETILQFPGGISEENIDALNSLNLIPRNRVGYQARMLWNRRLLVLKVDSTGHVSLHDEDIQCEVPKIGWFEDMDGGRVDLRKGTLILDLTGDFRIAIQLQSGWEVGRNPETLVNTALNQINTHIRFSGTNAHVDVSDAFCPLRFMFSVTNGRLRLQGPARTRIPGRTHQQQFEAVIRQSQGGRLSVHLLRHRDGKPPLYLHIDWKSIRRHSFGPFPCQIRGRSNVELNQKHQRIADLIQSSIPAPFHLSSRPSAGWVVEFKVGEGGVLLAQKRRATKQELSRPRQQRRGQSQTEQQAKLSANIEQLLRNNENGRF